MNAADRLLVIQSIFAAFGEDVEQMSKLVHELITNLPGEDWPGILTTYASSYQPFIDSGLSIDAWVQTVLDRANSMG